MNHFHSRAAEMHANIICASITSCGRDVFPEITRLPNGTVVAESKAGTLYHFRWNVTEQKIETLDCVLASDQIQYVEIAA